MLGGRFVLTTKCNDTDKELFNEMFVLQGHLDLYKYFILKSQTKLSKQASKILV